MPLSIAQVLRQRYQIQSLLGHGGFGTVYKAIDLNLNRFCAIKENLDSSVPAQQQFQLEAQVLSHVRHPNLPQIYDYFVELSGQQYLVMEFIEGNNLESLVQQHGCLPEGQVLHWMDQILGALEHLHAQQPPIIHRDIKPQNIIITPQGSAVLVDFGIAKFMQRGQVTMTGARAITPGYSPPEQYGGASTDARSDLFALGATIYFVLTGIEPPESVQLVAAPRMLRAPRHCNPQISPNTERVILQAMSLQPFSRPATAAEMRHALVQPTPPIQPPIRPVAVSPQPMPARPMVAPIPVAIPFPVNTNNSKTYFIVPVIVGNGLGIIALIALIGVAVSVGMFGSFTTSASSATPAALTAVLGMSVLMIGLICGMFTAIPFVVGMFTSRGHRRLNQGRLSFGEVLGDGMISGLLSLAWYWVCGCVSVTLGLLAAPSSSSSSALTGVIYLVILPIVTAIAGAAGGFIYRAFSGA